MSAVFFDLDQTLLDRNASLIAFLKSQHGRLFPQLNQAAFIQRFIDLDQNGYVWKDIVYQAMVSEFDIHQQTWKDLLNDYVNNFHHNSIGFAGLIEMLTMLKAQNYKLGIITNGRFPFQLQNIQALHIESYFDVILISEREGIRKPDPAIFERALEHVGETAVNAVMVGDNPIADIQGAKKVGMRTIWKSTDPINLCPDADAVCNQLGEINALVQSLLLTS